MIKFAEALHNKIEKSHTEFLSNINNGDEPPVNMKDFYYRKINIDWSLITPRSIIDVFSNNNEVRYVGFFDNTTIKQNCFVEGDPEVIINLIIDNKNFKFSERNYKFRVVELGT